MKKKVVTQLKHMYILVYCGLFSEYFESRIGEELNKYMWYVGVQFNDTIPTFYYIL